LTGIQGFNALTRYRPTKSDPTLILSPFFQSNVKIACVYNHSKQNAFISTMKKFLLPILLIVVASTAFTHVNSTVTRAAITFKTRNMGVGVDGTIGGLQADIHFNAASLAASTIEASVDVNTLNTDNSSRDEHLHGEDFFDVTSYPKIFLKSVSISHRSGNNYTGRFNLTIKAKTKQVDIPFTLTQANGTSTFKGSFKINRLDYGIGTSSLVLADEVSVNIDAAAKD